MKPFASPWRGSVTTALALAVAQPQPALAQAALSLDEALALSIEQQPALSAFTRTARAAEEAAVAARQLPDPQLTTGIQNLPVTGSEAFDINADFMTMKTIGIMRTQVREAKREAASARYLAEAAVSLAEQDVLARRIQREVMLGWIEVITAQQKREVLSFLIEKLEGRQSLVEDSILDGTATPADVIAIKAEISAARAELLAAQDAEAAGRAMLARWIGDAAQRPLSTNQLPLCRPSNKQQALSAVAEHPLIEVAHRRETVAERAIDVARADRKPDWGWSAMYGQRGGGRSDMVTLQVTIDLPLNRSRLQNRRIAEASELAAAARDRAEDARREVVSDFEQAWAQWSAANARLITTLGDTLPALEAVERALEARVAGGQPALTDVQAASERTTRTALEVIEQRAALARASADLSFYVEECA
ncbi:TolC family protein [Allosphingosinicella sp.]|uniref:TolC family protein n=1 Tax=Allosphingosinicella sp. TaxID=2823234 RepID=UPI002FC126CB